MVQEYITLNIHNIQCTVMLYSMTFARVPNKGIVKAEQS